MSQYSGKIVFYEGKCFTGRKLEICSDCDNFQDRGFMNRVNSVRVESGAFVCFDHPDFKGQQYILEHGEYPEFQRWNAHNDHMGSCRPIRMHGEHYRMELFEGDNFAGQGVELCDDCPFLQARGLTKNCINSIKVYGDGAYVSVRPCMVFDFDVRGAHQTFQYVLKHFTSLCLSNQLNFGEKAHLCDPVITGSFHTSHIFSLAFCCT
uniref:Crystallin, gamma N1 n=1 Tax=Amphilophus citrinellus TaxID=61819 RepID=A0A3Q0RP20_AMPCI